jgi:hypothetical protein
MSGRPRSSEQAPGDYVIFGAEGRGALSGPRESWRLPMRARPFVQDREYAEEFDFAILTATSSIRACKSARPGGERAERSCRARQRHAHPASVRVRARRGLSSLADMASTARGRGQQG